MQFEERLNNLHALNRSFNDVAQSNDLKVKDRDNQIEQLREMNYDLQARLKKAEIERETQSFKRILAEDTVKTKVSDIKANNETMGALREKYKTL